MSSTVRTTRDLALAAYMHAHGIPVARASARVLPSGAWDYSFSFSDSQHAWSSLSIAYANSPEARFNDSQKALKRLAKEHVRDNGRAP